MNAWISSLVVAGVALTSVSALAQDKVARRVHTPETAAWTARNLTPNRMELQVLAGPTSVQALSIMPNEFGIGVEHYAGKNASRTRAHFAFGAAFAPIDNLEVGIAFPNNFDGYYGSVPTWATYQFMNGPFQLGVRVALHLPTSRFERFGFQAGLPLMYRNGQIRLESGVHFSVYTFDPALFRFDVPFRLGFQITNEWYAGFETGVKLATSDGLVGMSMPLYGFVGFTFLTDFAPIDFGIRMGFDRLVNATNDDLLPVDTINGRYFSFSTGANLAIQF